jgi:hypothetical protein
VRPPVSVLQPADKLKRSACRPWRRGCKLWRTDSETWSSALNTVNKFVHLAFYSPHLGLIWQQKCCAIRKEEYTHGPYCSAKGEDDSVTAQSSYAVAESEAAVAVDLRYDSDHSDTEDSADETYEWWPTATALERVLGEYGISWAEWTSLQLLFDTPIADYCAADTTAAEALSKLQSSELRMPTELAASKPTLLKVLEVLRIDEAKRAVHYAKQKARRQRTKQQTKVNSVTNMHF